MRKLELFMAEAVATSIDFETSFARSFPQFANDPKHECARCARNVRTPNAVWLERRLAGGYWPAGYLAERASQGMFPFHPKCAVRELKETYG